MKKLGLGMATPILLLVILLGVAVFSATSSKQSNVRTDASRKATEIVTTTAYVQETITYPSSPTQVVTGTDDIPIYPGAQEYAGGEKYGPYTGLYDFIAAASMDDVTVFYKQELAKAGWALVSETREPTFGNRYSMEFDWANPKNEIPLRRYLHISLSTSIPFDGSSDISLDFSRWPDPKQIPTYPGAQKLDVQWDRQPEFGYIQRVITFETEASVPQVEEYYKQVLVEHGWWLTKPTPNPLIFTYSHSVDHPDSAMTPTNREELAFRVVGTGSTVELSTKRDQGGETKVELRVSGDEIERLYGQRQK